MGKKIFVVDDEHVIADTLTAILMGSGYEARPFMTPRARWQRARRAVPTASSAT